MKKRTDARQELTPEEEAVASAIWGALADPGAATDPVRALPIPAIEAFGPRLAPEENAQPGEGLEELAQFRREVRRVLCKLWSALKFGSGTPEVLWAPTGKAKGIEITANIILIPRSWRPVRGQPVLNQGRIWVAVLGEWLLQQLGTAPGVAREVGPSLGVYLYATFVPGSPGRAAIVAMEGVVRQLGLEPKAGWIFSMEARDWSCRDAPKPPRGWQGVSDQNLVEWRKHDPAIPRENLVGVLDVFGRGLVAGGTCWEEAQWRFREGTGLKLASIDVEALRRFLADIGESTAKAVVGILGAVALNSAASHGSAATGHRTCEQVAAFAVARAKSLTSPVQLVAMEESPPGPAPNGTSENNDSLVPLFLEGDPSDKR